MPRKTSRQARPKPKTVLRLPDLDQAKSAVLNSLSSVDAQRGYRHAIDEFVDWYCSEPRLSFSRTVVLRYRIHLESRRLAPGTVNLRLGAVRRLAYEAADCGLLSPDLAAGVQRVTHAQENGHRRDVKRVDQSRLQILSHRRYPTSNLDVFRSCSFLRAIQRILDPAQTGPASRLQLSLDNRISELIMAQH